jgi:hypothetical protein
VDLWQTIADEATAESPLWGEVLLPVDERQLLPVFSPLGPDRYALGLETIYEAYLLHFGRPRLFAPDDGDTSLLLGDYLYAHGLVRIARWGSVEAVADLAALISLCTQLRAERIDGDGAAWAATAALIGRGPLGATRDLAALEAAAREAAGDEAIDRAIEAHLARAG